MPNVEKSHRQLCGLWQTFSHRQDEANTRKAEPCVERTWDLGDISEWLILLFWESVLPLDF